MTNFVPESLFKQHGCHQKKKTENPILNINAPDVRPPATVGWSRQRLSQLRLSDAAQIEMLNVVVVVGV